MWRLVVTQSYIIFMSLIPDTFKRGGTGASSSRDGLASGESRDPIGFAVAGLNRLAQSDFIISAIGEELGLAGLFAILCLYLLLIARGLPKRTMMTAFGPGFTCAGLVLEA